MITFDQQRNIFSSSIFKTPSIIQGFGAKHFDESSLQGQVLSMNQTHGDSIAIVKAIENEEYSVDGMITSLKNVALIVKTADCVPIVYYDDETMTIGIAHCGWKGSLKRLAGKMINELVGLGSSAENIKIAIGPSIGACCYDLYGDRYNSFQQEFPTYSQKVIQENGARQTLDLAQLNYEQLLEVGLKQKKIDFFPFCTKCDENRLFSYQRGDKDSRMISYIMLQ